MRLRQLLRPQDRLLARAKMAAFFMALGVASSHPLRSVAAPVDPNPTIRSFTLKTETYSYQDSAEGELLERTATARRSDGTTVTVSTFVRRRKQIERTMRFIDFMDGRRVQLNDAIAAKTTFSPPPDTGEPWLARRILHPPKNCVIANYENFLRTETLHGARVDVVSASFTLTEWRAPALACEVIQSRQGYPHEGAFKLTGETKVVSLIFGEPDPHLFKVSQTFTEIKPSEMLRREADRWDLPWTQAMQNQADLGDKRYFVNQ